MAAGDHWGFCCGSWQQRTATQGCTRCTEPFQKPIITSELMDRYFTAIGAVSTGNQSHSDHLTYSPCAWWARDGHARTVQDLRAADDALRALA